MSQCHATVVTTWMQCWLLCLSSKASGLVWVWPWHYTEYCHFLTTMSEQEICTIWSKDDKQMLQVINKDATRKASITASVAQVCLAEDAIKNGTVVETVSGEVDTTTFEAKTGLDECIHPIETARAVDVEWVLETLRTSPDRVQLASLSNALVEMVGFGMVDVAACRP